MYKNTETRNFYLDIHDKITQRQSLAEAFAEDDNWARIYIHDTSELLDELRRVRLAFQEAINHGLALSDFDDLSEKEIEHACTGLQNLCSVSVPTVDRDGKPIYRD
jgi:hypothetical protein